MVDKDGITPLKIYKKINSEKIWLKNFEKILVE